MNTEIKKLADSGDIKSLKYIFVDSLDVDPTFVRYEEEYNYCKSIPGLLEPYIELTPFRENRVDWNEEYWTSLKMDLLKNFSDKRMTHMRSVAKVFLADKVQRIQGERAACNARNVIRQSSVPEFHAPVKKASISKSELQKQEIEKAKRMLEAENKAAMENRTKSRQPHSSYTPAQPHSSYRATPPRAGGEFSKKALGIAAAVAVAAVILFLLLK